MVTAEPLESALDALEEVDDRLRALYRELAGDPDLAERSELELVQLHAERRRLAGTVGFALLARRRAEKAVAQPPPESVSVIGANGTASPDAGPVAESTSAPLVGEGDSEVEPAPVSAAVLDDWVRAARASGVGHTNIEDHAFVPWVATLDALMTRIGRPRDLDVDLADEIDALDLVGRPPFLERWTELPRSVQQTWLGLLVARTRAVKEMGGLGPSLRARVKEIISRYPPWAADHQPGHVHGLRVDHAPVDGTWSKDADRLWESLRASLGEMRKAEAPARRKTLRRAEPSDASEPSIDPAWPLWTSVRGRRALIVGGDPREPNRQRLERVFELASLEWPDIEGPRRVDAVVARIRKRTVDLVIVLAGFIDHRQSEPIVAAAKESRVPWALADGYGSASVKAGLERFIGTPVRS